MSDKKRQPEEFGLEQNFARLEKTLELLESDELSLEEAFLAYSEGMGILKQCNEQIDRVEKQVWRLNESGQPEEFDNGEQ